MGFNLGVALGAGVKSAEDTYTKLNKEKRDQAIFDAWSKEQTQKEALTQAAGETFGQVGQAKYNDIDALLGQAQTGQPLAGQFGADGKPAPTQAIPNAAAAPATAYDSHAVAIDPNATPAPSAGAPVSTGTALPQVTAAIPAQASPAPAQAYPGTTPYTQQEANADFTKRAYGINFDMGRKAEKEGIELSNLRRTDTRAQAEDEFSKWHSDSLALIQADPTKWLQDNLSVYNKADKGTRLDDGLTGTIVKGADGSSSFVQTDKKGKVTASTPVNSQTAMAALDHVAFAKFQALPGKFKEGMELGLKRETLEIDKIKAQAAVASAGAAAVTAQAHKTYYEGLNDDRKAGNWNASMWNPDTETVGYTNPKKPGQFQDVYGKPIEDPTGFRPKEFKENPIESQARDSANATVAAGIINPATGVVFTKAEAKAEFYSKFRQANTPEGLLDAGAQKLQERFITAGTPAAEQQAAMVAHYNNAGIAPPKTRAGMQSGTSPLTGKPFTPEETKELVIKYPNTARSLGFGGVKKGAPTEGAIVTAPAEEVRTSAIPTSSASELAAANAALAKHLAAPPTASMRSKDPLALQPWNDRRKELEATIDALKPGGSNFRK